MTPPDRPAPQPAPDLDALFRALEQCVNDCGGDDADSHFVREDGRKAITSLRAQLAELQANQIPTPLPGMHYEQVPDGETLSEITAEWGKTIRAMMVNKAEAVIAKKRVAELEIERAKWRKNWRDELRARRVAESRVAALEAALKDADGWLPIALCPTDGVWRLVKLSDGNEAVAAFDGVGLLSKKRWQTKVFLTHRPACPSPINDLVTQPARDVFLIADLENGVYPTHFRPNDTVFGLPALKGAAT